MSDKRITIGGVDVTEHVAAMFDAIVGSLDWGSGFLDVETIESILVVAELAGFEISKSGSKSIDVDPPGFESFPTAPYHSDPEEVHQRYAEHRLARAHAIEAWVAQVKAKARALAGGEP